MYKIVSKVVQDVVDRKGDVKTLLYKQQKSKSSKINPAIYALTCQTLKYGQILEEIIVATPEIFKAYNHKKNQQNKGLILVLIYELLFGQKRKLNASKRFNQLILSNKNALHSALVRIKIKKGVIENSQLVQSSNLYKYARINTMLTNKEKIISDLVNIHRFEFLKKNNGFNGEIDENIKAFWCDEHIENLLIFSANCQMPKLKLAINGHLIIQNKSSCLPSFCLQPHSKSMVLDCCASPGNKTSHLLNIMLQCGNKSLNGVRIIALDHDKKRCETLKKRIKLFGMNEYIKCINMDFLAMLPSSEMAMKFDSILLDPTCSGSGLKNDRIGHYDDGKKLKVPKLSAMQKKMLLHAMTFKNVTKIVYSTCSVHKEENEEVVQYALNQDIGKKFDVIKVFDEWKDRGIDGYEFSESVIRVNNENEHNLHGFFVAVFERKKVEQTKKRKLSNAESEKCSRLVKKRRLNKKWKAKPMRRFKRR